VRHALTEVLRMLSPWKLLLIVAIILLLFGAGRIASLGKGLGEGIRNFKKGLRGEDEDGKDKNKLDSGKSPPDADKP
jgi:sec-independent protein translocase protein TatA